MKYMKQKLFSLNIMIYIKYKIQSESNEAKH